jgi:hypothetical protein
MEDRFRIRCLAETQSNYFIQQTSAILERISDSWANEEQQLYATRLSRT